MLCISLVISGEVLTMNVEMPLQAKFTSTCRCTLSHRLIATRVVSHVSNHVRLESRFHLRWLYGLTAAEKLARVQGVSGRKAYQAEKHRYSTYAQFVTRTSGILERAPMGTSKQTLCRHAYARKRDAHPLRVRILRE